MAISIISVLVIGAVALALVHMLHRQGAAHYEERRELSLFAATVVNRKDDRIKELDADYKALAETYARETGKVWIRPASMTPSADRMPPAQPNPWRMRPNQPPKKDK